MATAPQRLGWHVVLIAVTLALLLPDTAHAASRFCRQLEGELARTAEGRTTARSRKQDAATARQRDQLQLAKRQARKSGCSFRLFGGSDSCAAINRKIDRMERNLAALERRRSNAAAGSGRSRSQILAALKANRCRDEAVAERRLPSGLDGPRGLLDQIFGGGIRQRRSLDELGEPARRRDDSRNVRRVPQPPEGGWVNDGGRIRYSAPPGRYRTLCVRTCDGYFFPMSGSSSPSDFERDQSNCQASCPGTEVQIYYHRPEQESEAMVSGLSGRPYADLPAAWLYKQAGAPIPPGCACNTPRIDEAKNYSIIAGNPTASPNVVEAAPATPRPTSRPDPAADPETQANLDGGLDAEALRRIAVAPKVNRSQSPAEERKVRVVGPVFLPDPEKAGDRRVPVPTEVR